MAQSVELIVDPAAEAALRAQWDRLAGTGLPSARGAGPSHEQRPHITLYAADAIPPEVDDELPSLFTDLDLTVRIGPLMVFGRRADRLILVRAVAGSAELPGTAGPRRPAVRGRSAGPVRPPVAATRHARPADVP